jgi:phosphoribosyl 1,2-cyclic phosphodiesterase
MKIKILGNGGAINDGLPYNSFIIDEHILIEAPPDIMNSLYRENIDLLRIQIVYISHFHGDHYFGLPFLLLRLFFVTLSNQNIIKLSIYGPEDIKNKTLEICKLANGENHPLINWVNENIIFIEINRDDQIELGNDILIKVFQMDHFVTTYGFSCYKNNKIIFSYFADTLWNDELLFQIKLHPKIIIADLNGEPSDPKKVHLSEDDIIAKAIPECEDKTIFYGTHLKQKKLSHHQNIKYAYPGEIIEL